MVYMNVCVYIIIYLCIYVYIVLSPLYIISLALTKISIFKEATRNHIKFFFSCRFFVWFFFYSLGVFLYTKSVLLAFIFIFFFRYICMCVYMYTYSLHMYVCMCVNNKPLALQWREFLVRLHLPKKPLISNEINKLLCSSRVSSTSRYPLPNIKAECY